MSKIAYVDTDKYGRAYVRELVPESASPIAEWYSDDFSEHCISVPDYVTASMLYNEATSVFYPWCSIEEDPYYSRSEIRLLATQIVDQI